MQQPFSPVFTHPIMKRALEFIEQNILLKKVLIHCNHGFSRSPSIALMYLAKKNKIQNKSLQDAYRDFIKLYPGYTPGNGIYLYMQNNWQEIMDFI